jgi:DNA (cytosine-5)-methyltransferase 1
MVRCAIQVRPRVLFMENVEEIEEWGPLDKRGVPIPSKRGSSWRRFVSRLRNLGYACEWRRLVSKKHGAPTTRTRLVFVARCDGRAIVWPKDTHGPGLKPYRTAAECIDFSKPVPSIFLTKREAKAWGKAYGVLPPKRPLVVNTKRRIARGVMRYVVNCPDPFIIRFNTEHGADVRGQALTDPLSTLDTSNRFALVTPFLTEHANASTQRNFDAGEPLRTICAGVKGGHFALVSPLLVLNSEQRDDRAWSASEPIRTLTAANSRTYQMVAGFLAKHNAGHEATGQQVRKPIDAITTRDSKALVTSNLVKLRGGLKDHKQTAQSVREPAPTLTAGGTHVAEIRTTLVRRDSISPDHLGRAVQTCAFLVKFFGTGVARRVDKPADTITTKDRVGLVTVVLVRIGDTEYLLVDIGMRMLTPRELFLCQGFPESYQINCKVKLPGKKAKWLTKEAQTRLVGNSVPPQLAAAVVAANMHVSSERVA